MAIVEAAFITPLFFLLIFGIMEVGLALKDYLSVASTVRAGTRTVSASGDDRKADLYTVLNIARESTAINRDDIVRIVVYRPSGFGERPTEACRAGAPQTGVCNVYTPADFRAAAIEVAEETEALAQNRAVDPSKVTFGCKPTSPDRHWCPRDRNVRLSNPDRPGYLGPDYVGVWMLTEHRSVTGLLGSMSLTDQSVSRLEPRAE